MIEKIIDSRFANRFLVLVLAAALTVAGVYGCSTAGRRNSDLSENQVIVFTRLDGAPVRAKSKTRSAIRSHESCRDWPESRRCGRRASSTSR